jgi:hypothetical protein
MWSARREIGIEETERKKERKKRNGKNWYYLKECSSLIT